MPDWGQVVLGELLTRSRETVTVDPHKTYKQVTVRMKHKGVVLREEKSGATIGTTRQFLARPGQFIISSIDARNGANGLIPEELDGAIVTNDFWLFNLDSTKLDRDWLDLYSSTPAFVEACTTASEGTTNRVRLKEDRFLALEIPLPPLPEQQRIVARVKGLLAKVEEAQRLRSETLTQLHNLIAAEERNIWPDDALIDAPSLDDVTDYLSRGRQSSQGESQHYLIKTQHVQMGVYVPTIARLSPDVAIKVKPEALVKFGDTLIACSAAGCLGRVAQYMDDSGKEASTDTHVAIARPKSGVVTSDYLYAYLRGAQGQHQLRSRERGDWQREKVGFRLTELNVADMRRIPIPVPSLADQAEIVKTLSELRQKVDAVDKALAATTAQLHALPASILAQAFAGAL